MSKGEGTYLRQTLQVPDGTIQVEIALDYPLDGAKWEQLAALFAEQERAAVLLGAVTPVLGMSDKDLATS